MRADLFFNVEFIVLFLRSNRVRTYQKCTSTSFFVPAQTLITPKLLIKPSYCNLRKLQVRRRSLSNLTLLMVLPWTEPELLWGLLRPRAPPWYFPPKNQSCLPPKIRPPITNPSTVKFPLTIQWTPTAQFFLPSGISSLTAPSSLCNKQQLPFMCAANLQFCKQSVNFLVPQRSIYSQPAEMMFCVPDVFVCVCVGQAPHMNLWCDPSQEAYKRFCTKPTECAFFISMSLLA